MGVEMQNVQAGDGCTFPKDGQTVTVHYTGTLTNGQKFDSSRDRGAPFRFKVGVGDIIKGWDVGIKKMSRGERAIINISPDFAYGKRGYPGVIPPDSPLIFDIELLHIE